MAGTEPASSLSSFSCFSRWLGRIGFDVEGVVPVAYGLFAFALPGQAQSQTWARIGVDLEHELALASQREEDQSRP